MCIILSASCGCIYLPILDVCIILFPSIVLFYICLLTFLLQFFKGLNITAEQKKFFRKALHSYYEAAAELLQSEHTVSTASSIRASIYYTLWTLLRISFGWGVTIFSLNYTIGP